MNNKAIISVIFIVLNVLLFSSIQKSYSQQVWSPLGSGTNGTVYATAIYGGSLIAAGSFLTAGGQNVNHIAKWNGSSWSPLGIGTNDDIFALTVYNGNLIAAGKFTTAGGVTANRIAVWNSLAWSSLGSGLNDEAYALIVANSDLLVGGAFTNAGGVSVLRVARWYNQWTEVGNGFTDTVFSLGVFGSKLYAGGSFTFSGSAVTKRIAAWNGSSWQPVALGIDNGCVYSLRIYESSIAIGGSFTTIGGTPVSRAARWNGYGWGLLGSGFDNTVYALYSTASGLYAGGRFSIADFLPASRVAFYNGSSWSQVGTGIGGNSSYVKTISEYGGRVIFGGSFTSAGGVSANNIAAWGAPLTVKLLNSKVPEHFYLSQNYPNPFNPSTTIRFGVPENEHVRIEIHDVLGKEAGLLVNEKMSPGVYEVVWPAPSGDASNYPSGIYFCKLTAGDYNDVKKMIFLK